MEIHEAEFISSSTEPTSAQRKRLPEYAFIGRSNVGKSSLINMLSNRKQLAKTSVKPGKTQTINHFMINKSWYLVDLPGYGYAKTSKANRAGFGQLIERYLKESTDLVCLFVLIDIRLPPQAIDIDFINWAGRKGIPLVILFTKSDKVTVHRAEEGKRKFETGLLRHWDELPPAFVTSAVKKKGRAEVLQFIQRTLRN